MERMDLDQWSARDVARLLALVENERRYYQDLVADLPVALAVLAADRSVVSANRAFRQLLGARMEDLRGKTIEQVLPSDVLIEKIRDLTVNGVIQAAFLLPFRDKKLRVFVLALRHGAEESEILVVATDVTDIRSGRVADAGALPAPSAQPKQPDQQRITAERNAALRGLCGRLAHDLNNPLMIITGYAEELLGGLETGDPRRADAEQILTATQRVSDITEQLLQFTRKHANRPQPVELSALLAGLKEKIVRAAGKGVTVELPSAAPLWASCDPAQMEEILLALAFPLREGAQGRTRLRVALEATHIVEQTDGGGALPAGAYARVVMQDNGQGVDADKRRAMFEAVVMKDAQGKATDQTAATGIARAYAIAREWGGDIAFESEPSQGSAFHVYLPVAKAPSALPQLRPPRDAGRGATAPRETILVVDDEPGIRGLVVKILRRERYQVLEAGSAAEAVTVAVNHGAPVRLLVTDVMMPGGSGRQLAEQFRETMPDLKVLYMSGFTGDEFARASELPRGSRFLQKPFTLDALVGMVRELLDS